MFDQLLAQLPIESEDKAQAQEIAPLIAMGEEVLAQGDAERALTIFRQIGDIAPDNAEALSGQIRALVAMGETEQAQAVLDIVPEDIAKEQPIERARAALSLAVDTKQVEELYGLEARLAANHDDHEASFGRAGGAKEGRRGGEGKRGDNGGG